MVRRSWVLALLALLVSRGLWAEGAPALGPEEMEKFLKTAKILKSKAASKGITGSLRATLSDGTITHDAHVQPIDDSKQEFKSDRGTELNFRDSYKYNIAAYRLGVLLGIGDAIPMSVDRKVNNKTSAITWWVDDVLMDEEKRRKGKIEPPDPEAWNEQMYVVRVFDQLIYNTDRNLGNLLIDKNWKIWMIDHTRAFRLHHTLRSPKDLAKCETGLLEKLKALDEQTVMSQLRPWCTKEEVKGVMARRDLIVKFFQNEIRQKGEAAVLYTMAKK